MGSNIRITGPLLKVLQEFLKQPSDELSGSDIALRAKLSSGTLYPLLKRLEDAKWLESRWEDIDPKTEGRPRRRFYKITGGGMANAQSALRDTFSPSGVLSWQS